MRHDSASDPPEAAAGTAGLRLEPPSQGVGVNDVRERTLAVHLHDGQVLAVAGLELCITVDVDDIELEADLSSHALDDLERALAEVAAARRVEGEAPYG